MFCGNCFTEIEQNNICPYCGYEKNREAEGKKCLPLGVVLRERFVIGRVLGIGGFSITYKAYDRILQQVVAIKEYLPNEFSTRMPEQLGITVYTGYKEEQFHAGRQRFMDEAKKLAKFQYGNDTIVRVYDCFDENETSYIVMEFVEGKTVAQMLKESGPIPVGKAVQIATAILEALEQVHRTGILHRDIAPDNIIIREDGTVKLIDFGAARYATTKHSKSLSMILKLGYAPVEQYRSNGDQGPWTDVYGMAATLYKMITNVTPPDSMERSVRDTMKRPSKMGIAIRKQTENALMNALNIPIESRPQTAGEFRQQLMADKVKRKNVKVKTEDVGMLGPRAILIGCMLLAAVVGGLILIASGKLKFDVTALQSLVLEEGQTRVPNIVNTELTQAQEKTEKQMLTFVIADKAYSDTIPKDKVLNQSLVAGSVVAKNSAMEVTVSGGEETRDVPVIAEDEAVVPDVQYKTQEEAVAALEEAGITYEIRYEESAIVEIGHVIAQDIAADTVVKKGDRVVLTVSRKEEREPVRPQTGQDTQTQQEQTQQQSEMNQTQAPQAETQAQEQTPETNTGEGEWQTDYEVQW